MGTISAHTYCSYVLPLLKDYIAKQRSKGVHLVYQQDGASSHTSNATRIAFEAMGIPTVAWPAKSPDLNPIETVWNIMKDWIAKYYPEYTPNRKGNRRIVEEAWAAVGNDIFKRQIRSMRARCEAIIRAEGGYTHF